MLMVKILLCSVLIALNCGELQLGGKNLLTKDAEMQAIQPEPSKIEENIEAKPGETKLPFRKKHSGTSFHSKYGSYNKAVRAWKKLALQQEHPKSSAHFNGNIKIETTTSPKIELFPLKNNSYSNASKDHMQNKATSKSRKHKFRVSLIKVPAQFKETPSTEEMKDKPTEKLEPDVDHRKQFMFVARSKLQDFIKQTNLDADSNNVFGPNGYSNEERRTVTFDQAKEAITHAWDQCEGNPHCQLMQILGGIDNTIALQDWLIEQISFMNKLFVVQRKLITGIYERHMKFLPKMVEIDKDANINTTYAESFMIGLPRGNETKHRTQDYKKNSRTKSDSLHKSQYLKKKLHDLYEAHKKPFNAKEKSLISKSLQAAEKRIAKLNEKNEEARDVENNDIINVPSKHTQLATEEKNIDEYQPKQEESDNLTKFNSRKLLQVQSEPNTCIQGRDPKTNTSAGSEVKGPYSAKEKIAYKFVEVAVYFVIGMIFLGYYLYLDHNHLIIRVCFAVATLSLFAIYTITSIQVFSIVP